MYDFRYPRFYQACLGLLLMVIMRTLPAQEAPAAQEVPAAPPVPAREAHATGPRVIIIETSPAAERSEVIRQVVQALEDSGQAKRAEMDRRGKPVDYEAHLTLPQDLSHEKVMQLVETLKSLEIHRLSFQINSDASTKESQVVVQCPSTVSWRRVQTISDALIKNQNIIFDVRVAANDDPVTSTVPQRGPDMQVLRERQQSLERKARDLAHRLRETSTDPAVHTPLRQQLQDTVREAFELRQELQRAELAEFTRRLQDIEQSIEMRDNIKQQIIDRRVEELLDPNLDWDVTANTAAPVAESLEQNGTVTFPVAGVPADTEEHNSATRPKRAPQVQVTFDSRPFGKIDWLAGPGALMKAGYGNATIHTEPGTTTSLRLTKIPEFENRTVFLDLVIAPLATAELAKKGVVNPLEFLAHHAIPLNVTAENFQQAISGNPVTKVIYIPDDLGRGEDESLFETVVNTKLTPEVDLMSKADERGIVVAMVRLSNRWPADQSESQD